MKNLKKSAALVLTVLLCVAMLAACGDQAAAGGKEADYQVSVVDALGNPYTEGIIVRILSGDEQVAMQVVDAAGTVTKTLAKGDYTVELMFTGDASEYYYEQEGLTLSADQTSLEIVLAHTPTAEPQTLYVDGQEFQAYPVSVGGTYVSLTPGERSYFLFTPTMAGTYEFSAGDEVEQIGYYGAPHFVQTTNVAEEVTENSVIISVKAAMIGTDGGTSVYVIGVDAGTAESCILTVERTGEPKRTMEDEPWTVYAPTVELTPYVLPSGASVKEFDITAATGTYELVLDDAGWYHLDSADGPLVLVSLGTDVKYLDCFKTILDHTGVNRYFLDEDGNFLKKESYTECLMEYLEYMDENSGYYPLTEDLKYIIQNEGADSGWFDPNGSMYLFMDDNGNLVPGINNEISWLFMCRYIA
ncbi:MAG: hypothetical protein IJ375_06440 [Oscillospiraceae bacterium]|nr:hypothetical protein [Oscillospiraceae bacterium]